MMLFVSKEVIEYQTDVTCKISKSFNFLLQGEINKSKKVFDDVGITTGPFLMLRNSRLETDFYATHFNYDLSRCLDECLHRDFNM